MTIDAMVRDHLHRPVVAAHQPSEADLSPSCDELSGHGHLSDRDGASEQRRIRKVVIELE